MSGARHAEPLHRHARRRARRLQEHARCLPAGSRGLSRLSAGSRLARPTRPTPRRVRGFMGSLEERGLKASSAARRLSAVRQFHKFLYVEGYAPADPTAAISAPKRGRVLPKVLSVDAGRSAAAASRTKATERPDATPGESPAGRPDGLPARTPLRHGPARLRTHRAAAQRRQNPRPLPRGARQRRQGAPRAPDGGGPRSGARTIWRCSKSRRQGAGPWLFPADSESGHLTRQAFARDLKAVAVGGGIAGRQGQPARAAPCLREPPAPERRGFAGRAGAARPFRHLDDADLHPCARRAAEEHGARPASDGGARRQIECFTPKRSR